MNRHKDKQDKMDDLVPTGFQDSYQIRKLLKEAYHKGRSDALKYTNQLFEGHGWQMAFHYSVSKEIHNKFDISRNELMTLLAAYLYIHTNGTNCFTPADLSKILKAWKYTSVYNYSKRLINKKLFLINETEFSKRKKYLLAYDCREIFRSYSQIYYRFYQEYEDSYGVIKYESVVW